MPRAEWTLMEGRPVIRVSLRSPTSNQVLTRTLLADTGAGSEHSGFELMLTEEDCVQFGGIPSHPVQFDGVYSGTFPVYVVHILISLLDYDEYVRAVGLPAPPAGLDGIAGFRFLNRFRYGNLGDPQRFALRRT